MSLISIKNSSLSGPKYWRSLDQLAGTPAFREWVEREFPANASEMLDSNSRRTVLKLMAASFGLAGLTACSRPLAHALPFSKGVEDFIPGQAYFYSSVFALGGQATGLLIEAHDGRPTKIEGNPDHPFSLGAATALQQASVLSLYDPDRSFRVLEKNAESSWQKFEAYLKTLALADGTGLRFLTESVNSPSLSALRTQALAKFPKAKWVEYEPLSRENMRAGAGLAFGEALDAHPAYDKAKVIVSLDYDFLGVDALSPLPTKLYTKRRHFASEEDLGNASRLYTIESQFSLTGANADHRLRMRSSDVKQFAVDLASALGALPGALNVVGNGADKRSKYLAAVVKDLKSAGAEALVVAGPRQPASVHALAHAINQSLGSTAVTYTKPASNNFESGLDALKALTGEISAGQVNTLVILGGNPAYTAPADLQFGAALSKVANSIHLGLEENETTAASRWHLPEAHYLESWGDGVTTTGVASIQQPIIEPLHGGRTAAEIMALLTDSKDKKSFDIVKNFWTSQWPAASRESNWRKALNDGVIPGGKPADSVKPTLNAQKIAAAVAAEPKPASGFEVAFVPSASVWDGRFANNGWMQEAPDPMTKLTWGNAVYIGPATARAQNLKDGDMVSLSRGSYKLEAAVMIQPGHADQAASIALGYGRTHCGQVGKDVGFNANAIRTSDGFWFAGGFSMTPTGNTYQHASTQEHGATGGDNQHGRPLVREGTIEEYKKNPKFADEMSELPVLHSIYPEKTYRNRLSVGHGHRSYILHWLQRVCDCVPVGKQYPDCR